MQPLAEPKAYRHAGSCEARGENRGAAAADLAEAFAEISEAFTAHAGQSRCPEPLTGAAAP